MSFDPESQLFNMLDMICPGLDLPWGGGGGGGVTSPSIEPRDVWCRLENALCSNLSWSVLYILFLQVLARAVYS